MPTSRRRWPAGRRAGCRARCRRRTRRRGEDLEPARRDAGARRRAEVQRHAVGLAVLDGGEDAFARVHGAEKVPPPTAWDVEGQGDEASDTPGGEILADALSTAGRRCGNYREAFTHGARHEDPHREHRQHVVQVPPARDRRARRCSARAGSSGSAGPGGDCPDYDTAIQRGLDEVVRSRAAARRSPTSPPSASRPSTPGRSAARASSTTRCSRRWRSSPSSPPPTTRPTSRRCGPSAAALPRLPLVALFETAFFDAPRRGDDDLRDPLRVDADGRAPLRLPRRQPPRGERAGAGAPRPDGPAPRLLPPRRQLERRRDPLRRGRRHELRPVAAVGPAAEQPGRRHRRVRRALRHEEARPRRRRDGEGARERVGPRRDQRRLGRRARPRGRRRRGATRARASRSTCSSRRCATTSARSSSSSAASTC